MPTYIILWNYTEQGISRWGTRGFYLTMGEYDLVTVADFPNDDTAAQALLRIGQTGAVSSETLEAWPEDDYRDLIENLP